MNCRIIRVPQRGFSLVEILIAMAIATALLTAMLAAVSAMAQSWTLNDAQVRSVQAARLAALRMEASIRRCVDCQVGESLPATGAVEVSDSGVLKFVPTLGTFSAFRVRQGNLVLCPNDTGPDSEGAVLARNVSNVQFTGQIDPVERRVINVQIRFTISAGGKMPITITDSVVPRRTLTLQ